jgi:hypothetical protein
MSNLQLFRVTVTQTWTAEGEALVLASSRADAESAARKEVELDHLDADDGDTEAWAKAEPLETVQSLTKAKAADYWLIVPDAKSPGQWDTVDLEQFRQAFLPEELERMRIAAMEANNGQLALLGDV